MPSLRDGGVLCTFRTRTSATAAGFARSSKLSSSNPGQAVLSVREGGMDRPSQHKYCPAGLLSFQPAKRAFVLGLLSSLRPHCERHARNAWEGGRAQLRARVCKRLRSPGP
jgi:hypothetical protein